jgi:Flp pilus assembly protein TadG
MTKRTLRSFWTEDRAAISPLFAVGILALVGVAGVGFDYGRLMALDSELQNAADQAALAAVTQLDGGDDAMTRARDAANNTFATAASAYVNETRFANDKRLTGATNTRPITSLTFRFFDNYVDDTLGDEVVDDTDGAEAKVVEVTVNARQVFYALTPVVGALSSGNVIGRALAGLESATCNVPPMMFCVPNDADGVADTSFPTDADIGKGLHLHMNANAADPWAPGNFGFLDIDYTYPNGTNPNHTLGFNEALSGCTGEVIESETGVRDPQSDALNSRFDMYNNSMNNNSCQAGNGNYCPAENVRRDWVNIQSRNNANDPAAETCSSTPSNSWSEIEDLPAADADDLAPPPQVLPKDNCFIDNSCAVFGNTAASVDTPNWPAGNYMSLHHGGTALATAAPNGTRYEVYQWEIATKATALPSPERVGYRATLKNNGKYDVNLYCSFPQPVLGTAVVPDPDLDQKDRRVLTVAAVDCTGLNGSAPVRILRWVDLFLVQPAEQGGSDKAFFTEIVGPAKRGNGDSGFQYFGRKKAVLIR